MKRFALLLTALAIVGLNTAFKIAGKGENSPTVQSAFDGALYVRSVPSEDYGTAGKTQLFRVKIGGDELLDEYPVYMRGKLYLGWSPTKGKWCLVHLEPERITGNDDFRKVDKVSRLAFYMGGKEIRAYAGDDLLKMGLMHHVARLGRTGDFMVDGINQIPRTNDYVLSIEKTSGAGPKAEGISLDITTGDIFVEKAENK